MAEPTTSELKAILDRIASDASARSDRDAEWRGGVSSTLRTITDEQAKFRQDLHSLRAEHAETRRIASRAAGHAEDIEARALVQLATHGVSIDGLKTDVAGVRTGLGKQDEVLAKQDKALEELVGKARDRETAERALAEAAQKRGDALKRRVTILGGVLVVLQVVGAIVAGVAYAAAHFH